MAEFDFDLNGVFRLRLTDAASREAAIVQRQTGLNPSPPMGSPDIVVRFVDQMPETSDLRYIGLRDAAYTDEDFFVLKGKHKSSVRVAIPFEKIGEQPEIICERGINNIPFLLSVINFTLISKGILPVHASAFSYRGLGGLVTGWAKGGKTETLLSFVSQGARYVGDEYVYLCQDGTGMFGIPEPIRVWSWHLDSIPKFRSRLPRKEQTKLRFLKVLSASMDWLSGSGRGSNTAPVRWLQWLTLAVKNQMFVQSPPAVLFGPENHQLNSSIDQVIFTISHRSPETIVKSAAPDQVIDRMIFSLLAEQQHFYACYLKYRFAFPAKQNYWMDQSERIQRDLLEKALKGKKTCIVYHPYPMHLPSLFNAIYPNFD